MKKIALKVKIVFALLLIFTTALIFKTEHSYGMIRGYVNIYINLAFFLLFMICIQRMKGRMRNLILPIILYILFFSFSYLTLPERTYQQAIELVRQTEGIDDSVAVIPPRFYRNRFTGTTESGVYPTGYYVVVFENQNELLYYIDPYTGEYSSVEIFPPP